MNRIIQKTTSVILSLATVALIGAPAFAAYEPQEALNDTPAAAAEATAEPTEGRNEIEIDERGKEEVAQAQNAEPASAAAEEEPTEEKSETETAIQEETADDTDEKGGSELPEITEDDIIGILSSDEVKDALEEQGVDSEELIDAVENGEVEIIVAEDEEEQKTALEKYSDNLNSVFQHGLTVLGYGAIFIILIPVYPLMWAIPPIGAAVTIAGIPMGILGTLAGAGMIIASPVIAIFTDGSELPY